MNSFQQRKAAMQAQYDAENNNERPASFRNLKAMNAQVASSGVTFTPNSTSKFDRSAGLVDDQEALAEHTSQADLEDNSLADANGLEKSEEIAASTHTNSIPNNNLMDNRKLVSVELVVNIIAAIGGDCARRDHSVASRTAKLNVLRNKNSKTISNVRGYGAIRTNGNDGSCFLDVNVFPETAMTIYNTNNRPVIIFHYEDGSQAVQSEPQTEAFWRNVLNVANEVSIPNINPTFKVDLPADADVLTERIDAGTVQAVSVKFNNVEDKMFSFYSSDRAGRFVVYLKAAGNYEVSLLRDTVETTTNFLNYKGQKGGLNKFSGHSPNGRSGSNAVVPTARPQAQAAKNGLGLAGILEVELPKAAAVAPVVAVDAEKEALRAENAALKVEISDLKNQIADLIAGQSRIEAMLAGLNAAPVAQAEVSIPEVAEVVDPVVPAEVLVTGEEELARLEAERNNFRFECERANWDENGDDELSPEQYAELHSLDQDIADFKQVMHLPQAEWATALKAVAEKREAARIASATIAPNGILLS